MVHLNAKVRLFRRRYCMHKLPTSLFLKSTLFFLYQIEIIFPKTRYFVCLISHKFNISVETATSEENVFYVLRYLKKKSYNFCYMYQQKCLQN